MSKPVFSIEDVRSGLWFPPIVVEAKEIAKRAFEEVVNLEGSQLKKFPGDFRLVYVGRWDDMTGTMLPDEKVVICWASEVLRPDLDPRQLTLPVEGDHTDG